MSTNDELWLKRRRIPQTEDEWRSCEFFPPLVRLVDPAVHLDRKARLFTAACVRRLRDDPHLGDCGWVAEALERQADIPPTATEVLHVATALRELRLRCTEVMGGFYWQASIDYQEEVETDPRHVAWATADAVNIAAGRRVRVAAGLPDARPEEEHRAGEERVMCELLRCVFGNPFRPVGLDPSWQTSTVVALAQSIYEEQSFDGAPILADALEEAGCVEQQLLDHCRGPGPHARGCWAIDLLLGKR